MKKKFMGKLVHTSRIPFEKDEDPKQRACIEGFPDPVLFGVHSNTKKFYGVEPEEESGS
ncbi:MAG: hypothetical protein ACRD21_24530 [Vicinamibacteria bacterium]